MEAGVREEPLPIKLAGYAIMHFCTPNGDLAMGRWQELKKCSNTCRTAVLATDLYSQIFSNVKILYHRVEK